MCLDIKMDLNNHKYLGIGKDLFKALFSMENSFSVFRKSENRSLAFYDCISFNQHDCVLPTDVLTDILFEIRSGTSLSLMYGDYLCIRINGAFLSYIFCGLNDSDSYTVDGSFAPVDFPFLIAEREFIIKQLHDNEMVLDILSGRALPIKNLAVSDSFFGIQKEIYMQKSSKILSEYSVYKYFDNRIECINPNGNAFFDLNNVLFFLFNIIKEDPSCILLYNRRELEMVKDHYDMYLRFTYGA